jgi:hypothetical protein
MVQLTPFRVATFAVLLLACPTAEAQVTPLKQPPNWPLTVPDAQARAGNPAAAATPPAGSPQQPSQPQAAAPAPPEPSWTKKEIAEAQAQCGVILKRYGAVAEPHEPILEGECGTAYPVEVTRIGGIAFSQPAILNCQMIAVLGDWFKADVQPAARELLGTRIERIEVLSSYSCRNAYGRTRTRLSEHGRANAIDIKAFHTQTNQPVDLVADWGMTERDIKAQIAAAEAAARKFAIAKAKADAEADRARLARKQGSGSAVAQGNPGQQSPVLGPSNNGLAGLRGLVGDAIGKGPDLDTGRGPTGLSLGQPSRLGGPKTNADKPAKPLPAKRANAEDPNARKQFLRSLHTSACKRFGTVLGPEANEAHRNHFHLDMAERPRGNYCR